jgi:hypothetical protein
MSMDGDTPADRAGIVIKGDDKWRTRKEREPWVTGFLLNR